MSKRSLVRRVDSSRVVSVSPGDGDLLVVGEQGQVGVRDARDQADLHRLARLRGREVLAERGLAQRADAAEQIELVAGDRQRRRRRRADRCPGRLAARAALPPTPSVGQLVGAAHVVERARLLDVEDGDAQVAVVGERQLDQALQARVGEEALPFDLGAPAARRRRRRRRGLGRIASAGTGAAGRS